MPKILNTIAYLGQLFVFMAANIHTLYKWPPRK